MKILNVRTGFACNSSSTHSIVYKPEEKRTVLTDSYGWDNFILTEPKDKLYYFIAQVYCNLTAIIPTEYAKSVCRDMFNLKKNFEILSVDHQSKIDIPTIKSWEGLTLNEEFMDDLKEYILKNGIVIYGGNDNEYYDEDTEEDYIRRRNDKPFFVDTGGSIKAKKDGKTWILFNRQNGSKIRFSFEDNVEYEKAEFPELVDLNINMKCPNGIFNDKSKKDYTRLRKCSSYCYLQCNEDGKQADIEEVKSVIYSLSEMNVFEVAIGSGDLRTYSCLRQLLEYCAIHDVVPNVTMSGFDWLKDSQFADMLFELCGNIAVTISDSFDLIKIIDIKKSSYLKAQKIKPQVVCNSMSKYEFQRICQVARVFYLDITFLGFKETHQKKPYSCDCLDIILKEDISSFGIDTAFAQEYKEKLKSIDKENVQITYDEGKFSCYVDVVNRQISKSSYNDEKILYEFTRWSNKFIERFTDIWSKF